MKNELKNMVAISVVVILVILVVYLTTAVFMTGEIGSKKDSKDKKENSNASSVNSDGSIIAGRVFNQSQSNYMVIIYSKKDASDNLISAISGYKGDAKLYKVNTDEAVNKYVLSDIDNTNPNNSRELKVTKNALLTITNGSVSSYVSDDEQIIDVLK